MARSVSTHCHAVAVHYITFTPEDPEDSQYEWNSFIEDLQENVIPEMFSSMSKCDRWKGREDRIIMENQRFEISVSEYCGLVAICLAPLDPYNGLDVGAACAAGRSFNRKLTKYFPDSSLVSQGHASNGEQFFQLANTPGSCVTSKCGRLW